MQPDAASVRNPRHGRHAVKDMLIRTASAWGFAQPRSMKEFHHCPDLRQRMPEFHMQDGKLLNGCACWTLRSIALFSIAEAVHMTLGLADLTGGIAMQSLSSRNIAVLEQPY